MERGSLTVEAAIVIPVVLLVLVAVVEVIAAVGTQLELVAAAREGARVAATTPDPESAVAAVHEVMDGRAVKVSVTRPHVVGQAAEVRVRADKPLVTPLLGGVTIPLGARAVMRVER